MQKKYSMLSLGDSYTIGEAVTEEKRFPNQAVAILKKKNILFSAPKIIAKTGWTTDELTAAIQQENIQNTFDVVTLLIGVNNQYRRCDIAQYTREFDALLRMAVSFAEGKNKNVVVLSIPDWGRTPFLPNDEKKRTAAQISNELNEYNAINRSLSESAGVQYIPITAHSRSMAKNSTFIAEDKLHPSGKMYAYWAKKVADCIAGLVNKK